MIFNLKIICGVLFAISIIISLLTKDNIDSLYKKFPSLKKSCPPRKLDKTLASIVLCNVLAIFIIFMIIVRID